MSWKYVKLGKVLKQYRIEHIVDDNRLYKQVTISKHDGVCFRGTKIGKEIGRKRQFIIDLNSHPDTLLFVRQGVYDGAIGLAPKDVDGCIATENMPMFDVVNIEKEFLSLVLRSSQFKDDIAKIETTGTAQKSLHERQVLEIEIPLPDLEVQKEIVTAFSKVAQGSYVLSYEIEHQLNLVKQLRQAFLREAMQGRLVPQDKHDEPASELLKKIKAEKVQLIKEKKIKKEKELPPIKPEEIPFEIPENWVWCRLGVVSLYSEAGTSFKALETIACEGEYAVIKTSAITSGEFIEAENKKLPNQELDYSKIQIHKDDLLFCRASGSKGLAGKSCLVKFEPKTKLVLSDKSIRFILSEFISKSYIQYYSGSKYTEEYFLALGTKKSTTMNNITRDQFYELSVPLPPLSEQSRIVAKLDQLMRHCDAMEQSIKQSQTQNEQLLQQVLREALQPKKEYEIKDELSLAAESEQISKI